MQISVIIPTFNRGPILRECLHALLNQDFSRKQYEVIVIDDGGDDDSRKVVNYFKSKFKNLIYLYQSNQGQGVARNTGLKKASGEIIIFIGDDIIVKKDFLTEHMRLHLRHPEENIAVLGYTPWHKKLNITPYMYWLTNGSSILGRFGGHQFAYEKLEGKDQADFNFFYTSNISLKKSLLDKYPFDPSFSKYGWEDIELGYRLHKREGLRIYYNKAAVGYHHHAMDEKSLAPRMMAIGKSAWLVHRKHPELAKVPAPLKIIIFSILGSWPVIGFFALVRSLSQGKYYSFYYYALSKKFFLLGLRKGQQALHKE